MSKLSIWLLTKDWHVVLGPDQLLAPFLDGLTLLGDTD